MSALHAALVADGWTLDPTYRAWLAHGGGGCIIHFPEQGALPIVQYTHPMHADDAVLHGYPHEHATCAPHERLLVCERLPKPPVFMGSMSDGYLHVAAFGVNTRAVLTAATQT